MLRGTVLGLVVLSLSLAAHAHAGGQSEPATVLAAGALAVLGCSLLAGREFTLPRLLAVLLLGQLAVHLTLQSAMDDASPTAAPIPMPVDPMQSGADMGMAGGPDLSPVAADPMASMSGMADGPLGLSPSMLVGHVVAAVLAALVLRYGETLLLRVVAFLSTTPSRFASLVPLEVPGLPPQCQVRWEPLGGRTALLAHSLLRRGPPVAATS